MPDERLLTFRIMHAVAASNLPPHLRHFVMTLALLADSETGSAYYGQLAIGQKMGRSDRQVRNYFQELEEARHKPELRCPVQIVRRHRGTPDGKGRSSDVWQVLLLSEAPNRKPTSASDPPEDDSSTGTPLPVEIPPTGSPLPPEPPPAPPAEGSQPEVCDSSTGSLEQLNRKPTSGDRLLDRRSDRRSTSASPSSAGSEPFELISESPEQKPSKGKGQKLRSGPKPKAKLATDSAAHQRVVDHYHAVFEASRGCKPTFGSYEGSAVKRMLKKLKGNADVACARINNAFEGYRGDTVTIHVIAKDPDLFALRTASKKSNGHAPQQRDADSVNDVIAKAMGAHS